MKRFKHIASAFIALMITTTNYAQEVVVKKEHIKEGWQFSNIMRPSKNDVGLTSKITIHGNTLISSCLSVDGLHNGVLPQECRLLRDFVCFTNNNANGGVILMDLGKKVPISMINSYSAHGPVGGTTWCEEFDGSRAPQVYTLFASNHENPNPNNLNGKEWVKIASVDTRPNVDEDWVGQYGVNVMNDDGSILGEYQWIAWRVESTLKQNNKGKEPNWTDTWYTEFDVHTPATLPKAGDAIMAGTQLEEIIIAFKTHFDIGFTHSAPEIVNIYREDMIDNALKVIDESNSLPKEMQFSWTIPSWVAYQILWDGQDETRKERVLKAIKEKRLVVHGLPVTLHTESMEPEDLIAALSLNKTMSEKFGIPVSRSGKMTDVPSHSWILPTLMKNAGMDFLHIGVNPTNERPDIPLLFYWQGPDGSQLLTMQPQGYGSDCEFGHGLFPPTDWPYKHWLAMIVSSDNQGPPKMSEFKYLLKQAETKLPGVKLRFGSMEDFADVMFEEEKMGAKIPVIKADMPDCWIHGVGTMPTKSAQANHTRTDLIAAKVLDANLKAWGVSRACIADSLDIAQERSVMFGEHTWGGARNLQGKNAYNVENFSEFIATNETAQYLTQTWNDHAAYIDSATFITNNILSHAMSQLANEVSVSGERVVIFNPLPWTRDAHVRIDDKNIDFIAKNIPACGYKTYPLKALKATKYQAEKRDDYIFENRAIRVTIDRKKGGIISIIDKKQDLELVDPESSYAFGQYIYEKFDKKQTDAYQIDCAHLNTVYGYNGSSCYGWNTRADIPAEPSYRSQTAQYEDMHVVKTNTGVDVVLEAKSKGIIKSSVLTTISLYDEKEWFDINVKIKDKEPDYWPEAGSIYFGVNAKEPQFRLGRVGGVVNPVTDFAKGSNRTYGIVNTGAMIADSNGAGLAISPLDHGMMSFGEKGICEIDPEYVPTTPETKVIMYNTLWTINFPYWIQDSLSSTVRIWAVDNIEPQSLIDRALEARNPVQVGFASGKSGKLPKVGKGISLSREGIRLCGITREKDGDLYQFWEYRGEGSEVVLTLPKSTNYTTAQPVNLRGDKIGVPIAIVDNKLNFKLDAYKPASFILK